MKREYWRASILYETRVEHLNFVPSDECIRIQFVNKDDLADLAVFPLVKELAVQFDSVNHR